VVNDPGAKESLLNGVGLLEEAVRRDPNFLLAYCLLCDIHLDLYWFGFDHTPARREQGNQALQKARNIQPDAGAVHLEAATYAYHGFRDYETARRELELAQRKLPNSERVYSLTAVVDRRQGRWDDAVRNFSRAVELDPRNFATAEEAGFTYDALRRYAEGRELLRHAIELFPKDYGARIALARSLWLERGDLAPLRAQLNELVREGTEATRNAAQFFVYCALAEHDHAAATQALNYIPAEGTMDPGVNFVMPRDWYVGLVAHRFGDTQEAAKAFTAARAIAGKTVAEQPDYAEAWGLLGAIDAGLGRKADAIAEGKHACELLPISKDSFVGPVYVVNLALIYTWVGEKDLALDQLQMSASIPNGISYGGLKLDPTWDPLRGDPRFEKLVTSLAPKPVAAVHRTAIVPVRLGPIKVKSPLPIAVERRLYQQ
jgi:tetratricopeptide (TPR) repeat protein